MDFIDEQNGQNGSYFVFREAANAGELLELFQLRYQVYRNSKLARFIPESEYGINLDCYDARSRHFGLFCVQDGAEHVVGYLRVAEDQEVTGGTDVFELAKQFPGLASQLKEMPPHPFPLMTYFPDADALTKIYNEIKVSGEHLVEACRFALDPHFRSLRLAKHMVESAIAIYFFFYNCEHAVWCCDSSNKTFYRLYGFRPLGRTKEEDFAGIGVSSCCVFGSATSVPNTVRERLTQTAQSYQQTGRICYHLSEPGKFHDSVCVNTVEKRGVVVVR
jgi:ribosomal protein S18 acetylase RimI-like enzyme